MICSACYSSKGCNCLVCSFPGCEHRLTRATKPSGHCRQHHPDRCPVVNDTHLNDHSTRGGEQCNNITKGGGACFKHRKEGWLPVVVTATILGEVTHE